MVMVTDADGCALLGSMVGGHQDWDVDRIGKVNAEGRTIFPLDIRPRMTHDKRMKAVMNHKEMIAIIRKKQGDRTLTQFAGDLGLSPSYLSDVMRGRRPASDRILKPCGLGKVTRAVREVEVEYFIEGKQS